MLPYLLLSRRSWSYKGSTSGSGEPRFSFFASTWMFRSEVAQLQSEKAAAVRVLGALFLLQKVSSHIGGI